MTIEFPPRPLTIAVLLDRIREQRLAVESLFAATPEAELVTPPVDWSPKDHIAHLVAWHGGALAVLRGLPSHEGLGVSESEAGLADDALNVILHARWQAVPPSGVLAAFRSTLAEIEAELATRSDADLFRKLRIDEPEGRALMDVVVANTYEHAIEHLVWIAEQRESRAR
jgi:hypothetical protein